MGGSGKKSIAAADIKLCPVCDKTFTNRKKWRARGVWESVKYCSERCRRNAPKENSAQ